MDVPMKFYERRMEGYEHSRVGNFSLWCPSTIREVIESAQMNGQTMCPARTLNVTDNDRAKILRGRQ